MNNITVTVYDDIDPVGDNDCIILFEGNFYYYALDIIMTQFAEVLPTILEGELIPSADAASDCGPVLAIINCDLETMTITQVKES